MRKFTFAATLYAVLIVAFASSAHAADSLRWLTLRDQFFKNEKIIDDPRVVVTAPKSAEDSMNVPIGVRVEGLTDVQEVRVLVDYNPIIKAIEFFPIAAAPALTFRLKLQQSSPVRALARTKDGVWHHGVTVVEAAGGGCTAPSNGSAAPDWSANLNAVASKQFARDSVTRLRLQIQHPMDTGLAPGVPAFFIEKLAVVDAKNRELMRLHVFEPISENPIFSIDIPSDVAVGELSLRGVDNQGNRVQSRLSR
jgi:sulfur-oxidizing protein SoxY